MNSSLSNNRSWQFLVGCFTLFLIWKLHSLGAFSIFFKEQSEGFENGLSFLPLVLTAAVNAVQLVGIVSLMLIGGLQGPAEKFVDYVRERMPRINKVADVVEEKVDVDALIDTLNKLDERIRSIEIKVEEKK